MAEENGSDQPTTDVHLRETFHQSVDEGKSRLERRTLDLAATGLTAGIDVSLGILALLVIEHATGSRLLGALGFILGFIALTLGKSELFTENFLVPVAAVVAKKATLLALLRLWVGTALLNLVGGWCMAWLIVIGLPHLQSQALKSAQTYVDLGFAEATCLGLLAGIAITFMTWMEHGAKSEAGKIAAVSGIAFLLAATPLNHVVVVSVEIFAALHTGWAGYGYGRWLEIASWAALMNMAGGLLFVTVLRLSQVGWETIRAERERRPDQPREDEQGKGK
jgi:formate/nitrite transporter FocA (FNT family)